MSFTAYLSKVGWTVIMVDWTAPSKVARYETAVNNAFIIATLLAEWISKTLINGYLDASRMHIVGFSMGAHIAGNVGKRITGGKVAKIFGKFLKDKFSLNNEFITLYT